MNRIDRVNEIEDLIARGEITAAQVFTQMRQLVITETPGARWREAGEPDPHGDLFNQERARLCMGHVTDDELANEVFLKPTIGNLTAAKERIRWLSRRLEASRAEQGDEEKLPRAGLEVMGNIEVDEGGQLQRYDRALVLTFNSTDEIRRAIAAEQCTFGFKE
mgnify:CR=1 FL=1|tara:strand:- start:6315 stop:6803 length:489 start_codon:yes stop_codon:yes gene_type:complete